MKPNDKLIEMGFGLPSPASEIIYNDENEITLILNDTLIKGEFIEILEFPFPQSMTDEDGYFTGQVSITVVGEPVLRNQGNEYCQSNLEVSFGTYDQIKHRDITKPIILNEYGPDGANNILLDSHYSSKYKKETVGDYAAERMLINYGKKYNPTKKYNVDLTEMTNGKKEKILASNKKWFLKVRGLYRDFAEEMAQIDGEELSQKFSLIITIKDPTKQNLIYNEVSQLLENGNFVHSNINLRTEIRINN